MVLSFKLEKSVMTRRRVIFTDMGIEFKLGIEIGKELSLDHLVVNMMLYFSCWSISRDEKLTFQMKTLKAYIQHYRFY